MPIAPRIFSRRFVLVATLVGMICLFAVTAILVSRFRAVETGLGHQWYARGERDLSGGRPGPAIDAFRTALVYDRENFLYRLRLAEALAAAGRLDEAHAYLVRLWQEQPGNGRVDLALARVAVQRGDTSDAERYYHQAIYGYWQQDGVETRERIRIELARTLMARGANQAAESDLVALAADLPPDSPLHTRLGELFVQAGSPLRARDEFAKALEVNANDVDALGGAAKTSFELGDYERARTYATRALALRPDSQIEQVERISALVLDSDPSRPHLSRAERERRVIEDFEHATARFRTCLQSPPPDARLGDLDRLADRVQQAHEHATPRALARDPDLLDSMLDLAFEAADAAGATCGPGDDLDQALVLLAAQHRKAGRP